MRKQSGKIVTAQNDTQNDPDELDFWVPEQNLEHMETQFKNLNEELETHGHGHASYEIMGKEMRHTDKGDMLMYQIHPVGEFHVDGVEYLGRYLRMTDENKDTKEGGHFKFSAINPNISEDDYKEIESHPKGCDCCKKSYTNQSEFYCFRCTKDFTVGKSNFKEGEICFLGSSCVDKFVSKKASAIVSQFAGKGMGEVYGERSQSYTYIDPVLFAGYMDTVATSHIDDVYQHICKKCKDDMPVTKTHTSARKLAIDFADSAWSEDDKNIFKSISEQYGDPKNPPYATYRKITKSKDGKGYGCEGSISKTARAMYLMMENGYYDTAFFKNTAQVQVFKDLCKNYKITKDTIHEKMSEKGDDFKKVIQDGMQQNPQCALDEIHNINLETMSDIVDSGLRINRNYTQFIVDIFDQAYLSEKQDARYHETTNGKTFEIKSNRDNGKQEIWSEKGQIEAFDDKKGMIPKWAINRYSITLQNTCELFTGGVVPLRDQRTNKTNYYRLTNNNDKDYLELAQISATDIKNIVKNSRVAMEQSRMSEIFNPDGSRILQPENVTQNTTQNVTTNTTTKTNKPPMIHLTPNAVRYRYDVAQKKKVPAYATIRLDANDIKPAFIDIRNESIHKYETGAYGIVVPNESHKFKVRRTVNENGRYIEKTYDMTYNQIDQARSKASEDYYAAKNKSAEPTNTNGLPTINLTPNAINYQYDATQKKTVPVSAAVNMGVSDKGPALIDIRNEKIHRYETGSYGIIVPDKSHQFKVKRTINENGRYVEKTYNMTYGQIRHARYNATKELEAMKNKDAEPTNTKPTDDEPDFQ